MHHPSMHAMDILLCKKISMSIKKVHRSLKQIGMEFNIFFLASHRIQHFLILCVCVSVPGTIRGLQFSTSLRKKCHINSRATASLFIIKGFHYTSTNVCEWFLCCCFWGNLSCEMKITLVFLSSRSTSSRGFEFKSSSGF